MDPAAMNFGDLNWLGIGLAMLALIIIGFVWYAPWFPTGKVWLRAQGMDAANMPKPAGGKMAVSMVLMVLGSFLMMFVFAHTFMVYEDAYRNTDSGGTEGYELSLMDGVMGAFFTWLGFIVPLNLNTVAFENRPWSFFFVNAGYYLVGLMAAGILLAVV
jgi:heme/copper-type cytochrome/quinol oxidase subunit 2